MNYITVRDAAQKWGVSLRRVQLLCNDGRIKGAYRFGKSWMIPETAVQPNARRKNEAPKLPLPRKSPFLDMTNLYNRPGAAEECIEMLINHPEAHALLEAQIAYRRGEIDKVYGFARYFLSSRSGFYAILGGGILLALCAIWRGDIYLWNEAKRHIFQAPHDTPEEREIISLTLAIIDSSIYDNKDFPEWFISGNFEALPPDAHPAAKVYYIKYLYMAAFAVASKQFKLEGVEGLALMRIIPNTIEPLITQAVVDRTVIPEIFLRMSCAVAYHNSGQHEKAVKHIDRALELALPDRLYGLLAEYIRHFGGLLEERIALKDEEAVRRVSELYDEYRPGWARLSGIVRNKQIAVNLSQREHECAKLTAFGFKPKEIASMMYLSESTVRFTLAKIEDKTGIYDHNDFHTFL